MARLALLLSLLLLATCMAPQVASLQPNFYAETCPNVEKIVRAAVVQKVRQTFVTIPATIRLFFHDCFVNGCDASVIIQSTPNNKAEKDNPINLSLAGDGFDTVIKAKAAVDKVRQCRNKVSCADILAIAARDAINLAGGPFYPVELGRLDGLVSTASSVNGKLPDPDMNLDQLTTMFDKNGLSQADMIALSACHTVGFSHCSQVAHRLYNFTKANPVDPTLSPEYATQLKADCPKNVDPRIAIPMDPVTPKKFDKQYYINLINGTGLFTSDQILYTDKRSRPIVVDWAQNDKHFNDALILAMTKMGRIGVKTRKNGNIRIQCDAFN
ncbi:hypothetical protein Nepgr_027045 [Nepenthes gracilis]|uniref:Peroxidase n=1 Tax=Nepenthes gracilis TaxID=150966 RepID=A0AAD3TB26_NEPGR|nr:hypothetical protein Nepgr_027045 [Nepenthes gracilis]